MKEIVINSPEQIKDIANELGMYVSGLNQISVQLGFLSEYENKRVENSIRQHYFTCGCSQGRYSGVITSFAYFGFFATGVISVTGIGILRSIILYFVCVLMAMGIGKIYGLWNARTSLRKLAHRLQQHATYRDMNTSL